MANTKQGIYYQDNYSSVADVPNDMKKMAESVDTEIEKDRERLTTNENNIKSLQTDNTTNKKDISDIKSKNAAQDTNIETLTQRLNEKDEQIAELEDKVSDLNNNQIHGKASGEYVHLVDSAKMECGIAVLGNSKQETREGYNLLKNTATSQTIGGVEFTVNEDGTVIANGTATADVTLVINNREFSLVAGMYTISGCPAGGSTATYRIDLYKSDWSGICNEVGNGSQITLAENTENAIVGIIIKNGVTVNNLVFKPMIVAGTKNKEYEQYGAMPSIDYPSEIECVSSANVKVCNKNLLDTSFIKSQTKNGVTITRNEDGTITLNGTIESDIIINNNILFNGKNKIFSIKKVSGSITGSRAGFVFYDEKFTNDATRGLAIESGKDEGTIKLNEKYKYVYSRFFAYTGAVCNNLTISVQLEENTTATDYITHEEQNYTVDMQEPFREINDIRDCFVLKEDGKWYERHNIKRIVVDGVNYLSNYIFDSGWFSLKNKELNAYVKNAIKVSSIATLGNILCNKYETITQNRIVNHNNMGVAIALSGEIYIKLDDATSETSTWTTDTVNAFLQENPLTIDYALAEPYYIECTEQQTQQLQALQKAKTYKNITNIATDTIAVLDVDYKRDLETYQKQQDDRITAIEQLLSTTTTSAMLLDNVQSDLESEVQ